MKILKEFKAFGMKIGLADITAGIISPPIEWIFNTNFKDLKLVINEGMANTDAKIEGEFAVV